MCRPIQVKSVKRVKVINY